jgi:hypothetical protein
METLRRDLRFGIRELRRNRGFAAVAVITLALGIRVNTAVCRWPSSAIVSGGAVSERALGR